MIKKCFLTISKREHVEILVGVLAAHDRYTIALLSAALPVVFYVLLVMLVVDFLVVNGELLGSVLHTWCCARCLAFGAWFVFETRLARQQRAPELAPYTTCGGWGGWLSGFIIDDSNRFIRKEGVGSMGEHMCGISVDDRMWLDV
jgi:hypothetical protein